MKIKKEAEEEKKEKDSSRMNFLRILLVPNCFAIQEPRVSIMLFETRPPSYPVLPREIFSTRLGRAIEKIRIWEDGKIREGIKLNVRGVR